MTIRNKEELKQTVYNHSSDIDFKDYGSLQKMYCKTILLLVIDDTLASDNPLHFRKNLIGKI